CEINESRRFFMSRTRRTFTPEFKLQMDRLFENSKSKSEIVREYDLTASALDKWVKNHQNTGSFNHIDNLSEEERELRRLRKDIQQLKMENEILKQAALLIGRKKKSFVRMHTNIQCQQCAKSCKSLEVPIILKLINKGPTSSVSAITISMKRLFRYLIQTENVLVPEE